MSRFLISFFILLTSFNTVAAQKSDHWYKVETKKGDQKQKKKTHYHYDSVEKDAPHKKFSEVGFWSLRPKVGLSGGFHADKSFFKEDKTNRFFFNASLQFRTRPWNRITVNTLMLQNNTLFLGGAWEFTPSRERVRTYYGIGAAHLLLADKQFTNFVDWDQYYLTIQYGWEILLKSQHGWNVEVKAFYSSNNYAIQLGVGYIIPF